MSYCRFVESDVYMYPSCNGGITCCLCKFSEKVITIFTTGSDEDSFLKGIESCENCKGSGCDECMGFGDVQLNSYEEALEHLEKHRESGDNVPEYAFERLRKDMEEGRSLEPMIDDYEEDDDE